jgi:hypothetical protein
MLTHTGFPSEPMHARPTYDESAGTGETTARETERRRSSIWSKITPSLGSSSPTDRKGSLMGMFGLRKESISGEGKKEDEVKFRDVNLGGQE